MYSEKIKMWRLSHLRHHLFPISMNESSPGTEWNVDEENGSRIFRLGACKAPLTCAWRADLAGKKVWGPHGPPVPPLVPGDPLPQKTRSPFSSLPECPCSFPGCPKLTWRSHIWIYWCKSGGLNPSLIFLFLFFGILHSKMDF